MANVILTKGMAVELPAPLPPEGVPMVEGAYTFPRFYFAKDAPAGRPFESQEELDAAGGEAVWKRTPQDAQAAAEAAASAPAPESESPTPRPTSRR